MVSELISKSLSKATGERQVHLEFSETEAHGDFATNVAMQIATRVKEQESKRVKGKSAREIAEKIVGKLKKDEELAKVVSKIEVAGPGFINFFLSSEFLLDNLEDVLKKGDKYGSSNQGKGKTAIIEYSSPNIAKQFSVGHLRSTIIGQALYNLYQFIEFKVVGDNHLGDWGTQFGMIIAQVVKKKLDPASLSIDDYEKLYIDFNKKAEKEPELKEEGRTWFKKLEDGDKKAREIWGKAVKTSLSEFGEIYQLLGVKIDNAFGESFYEDKMQRVIKEVRNKGFSKKSKGAEIVEFKDIPPAILLKSDGGTTYFTRDLATVKFRVEKWQPTLVVYEVGAEQKLHFKQVFETAKLMGWDKNTLFVHVAHGLFIFKGKKMSTRRGTAIKLEDVLKESIKRARIIIEKSETSRGLTSKQKAVVAEAVGVGAIKYFDLVHHPTSNIDFNWETTLSLEGNSAPYLQYTIARTNSVLVKAKPVKDSKVVVKNFNREELMLLRSLPRFSGIIVDAAKNYSPNLLCNFLFDLAQKYNAFYNKHKILGSKEQSIRLGITQATGQVLKNGLTLLGIQAPERM